MDAGLIGAPAVTGYGRKVFRDVPAAIARSARAFSLKTVKGQVMCGTQDIRNAMHL